MAGAGIVELSDSTSGNYSELVDNGTETNSTSDYYYYDANRQFVYEVQLYLTIICYAVAMLVGTVGNLVVVYTIWRCRHLHTVMYTLLASLCMADLIMLVFVLPWRLNVFLLIGPWPYGDFMCRFPIYLHIFSVVSSVFHLTAISMERCYAVKFPLKSRAVLTVGNAYKIVVVVWGTAFLTSIPALFSVATKYYEDDEDWDSHTRCSPNWPSQAATRVYSLYLFFLVFGVPMVLITGAYTFIMLTLCTRRVPSESTKSGSIAMSQSRKYQTSSTHNGSAKTSSVYVANGTQKLNRKSAKSKEAEIRQMTVMLMVVIVLFAICWGPLVTYSVVKRFGLINPYEDTWFLVSTIFNLMSFLNSAINPVVYALVSASFRQSCVWALKVCCKSRNVRRRPSAVSRATTVSRSGMSYGGGSTAVDNVSVSSVCAAEKV